VTVFEMISVARRGDAAKRSLISMEETPHLQTTGASRESEAIYQAATHNHPASTSLSFLPRLRGVSARRDTETRFPAR